MGDGDGTVVESWDGPGVEGQVAEDVGCIMGDGEGIGVSPIHGPGEGAQVGKIGNLFCAR